MTEPARTESSAPTSSTTPATSAAPPSAGASPTRGAVQLKKSLVGHSFAVQAKMLEPRSAGLDGVQAKAAKGVGTGGGRMPHADAIQASFGKHDIGSLRAHTGGEAMQACDDIGAEAYASGERVAFGSGAPDLHTAAHEAAHVVQQRAGVSLDGGVGRAGDSYEQQADAVADRVVQGQSAEDLLPAADGAELGRGAAAKPVQRKGKIADLKEAIWKPTGGGLPMQTLANQWHATVYAEDYAPHIYIGFHLTWEGAPRGARPHIFYDHDGNLDAKRTDSHEQNRAYKLLDPKPQEWADILMMAQSLVGDVCETLGPKLTPEEAAELDRIAEADTKRRLAERQHEEATKDSVAATARAKGFAQLRARADVDLAIVAELEELPGCDASYYDLIRLSSDPSAKLKKVKAEAAARAEADLKRASLWVPLHLRKPAAGSQSAGNGSAVAKPAAASPAAESKQVAPSGSGGANAIPASAAAKPIMAPAEAASAEAAGDEDAAARFVVEPKHRLAIERAMSEAERSDPTLLRKGASAESRLERIAKGSGVPLRHVKTYVRSADFKAKFPGKVAAPAGAQVVDK